MAGERLHSIDALRGFVMIVMALDHVRDYFHAGAMSFQPEDLTRTTVALFFTRWITHICAPVFAFTAGLGAYLWYSRRRDIGQLSRFLWTRGLWLVLLELTVLRFAMFFSLTNGPVLLGVLWVLGWSMIVLGFLARLPLLVLAGLSIAVIFLHNLADGIPAAAFGSLGWLWNILHQPGLIGLNPPVLVAYPLVPWFAVMSAGFCCGPIALMPAGQRKRWLVRLGVGATLAFLAIRAINIYGDPQPWSVQSSPALTVLSFLRATKYPPSLSFLLMTLGPALLLLRWLDERRFLPAHPLIVFGRVPLFYFLGHFFLLHALVYPFAWIRYGTIAFLSTPLPTLGGSLEAYPPGFGYDLPAVYGVWILVVLLMYPACLWMARLKERRKAWWLSYL